MIAKFAAPQITKTNRLDSKARATDAAARAIIDAEVSTREAKTLRLRAARLKAEAEKPIAATVGRVKAGAR
jgi:hypothetical protein